VKFAKLKKHFIELARYRKKLASLLAIHAHICW